MAEDEQTILEGDGAAEGSEANAKKGPNKLILFGGIGVGAIVIGIVLALFVIGPMMSGGSDEAAAGQEEATHESSGGGHGGGDGEKAHGGGHGESGDSHGSTPHTESQMSRTSGADGNVIYSINEIIVNPAGTNGSRFLSTSIGFELSDPKLGRKFEERETVIRDALITILSAKTVTELTTPRQREITRYQIRKRVAQLLGAEDIAGVYYTDFVLQ